MADPLTPNVGLSVPIRGSDVGTWDIPVNGDFTILDSMAGAVTTLALSATPISPPLSLLSSQAQTSIIRLTGTLTSNVFIMLPSIYKSWTIDNQLLNSPSSFCATLISTAANQGVGLPPGQQDVFYDGNNVNYKNLGRVGEYWDYAALSVPTWVNASTIPPYLYCNGTSFSSATYPVLANLLGSNVLPDSRGRGRFTLGDGTGRLTTAGAGIDGTTLLAAGGNNGVTLVAAQIPSITASGTVTVFVNGNSNIFVPASGAPGFGSEPAPTTAGGTVVTVSPGSLINASNFSGANNLTYTNGAQTDVQSTIPGYVGGITMIRAM